MPPPDTVIIVHPSERRSKCTVEPLRGRAGFRFYTFTRREPQRDELAGYVRLGMDGPVLSAGDSDRGLLVLDGTWRYAERMERAYADVPVRTLPAWKTAYPRVSKLFDDPHGGLATIEAIFAAFVILGRDTAGLLDDYHWHEEFLAANAEQLKTYPSGRSEAQVRGD